VTYRRRKPIDITFQLLRAIDTNEKTTKLDLTHIVGTTNQFRHYVENFLIKGGYINEAQDGRIYYYYLTRKGMLFLSLLKRDDLVADFLKISGRTLRTEDLR